MTSTVNSQQHNIQNRVSRGPLTKSDVAHLSQAEIRQMDSEELINVILAAKVPFLREYVAAHLWYSDRATLEKVAFLAQRTLRNEGY